MNLNLTSMVLDPTSITYDRCMEFVRSYHQYAAYEPVFTLGAIVAIVGLIHFFVLPKTPFMIGEYEITEERLARSLFRVQHWACLLTLLWFLYLFHYT